jgi:alkylhydroperoxidase family enzyme
MRQGVTEEMYVHVAEYRDRDDYTEREKLAIEYAERFALDHRNLDDEFFVRLREHYGDDEILDLSICLVAFMGLGRVLSVLRIDPSGPVDW